MCVKTSAQLASSAKDHSTECARSAYPDCVRAESTAPAARRSVAQGAAMTTYDVPSGSPSLIRASSSVAATRRDARSAGDPESSALRRVLVSRLGLSRDQRIYRPEGPARPGPGRAAAKPRPRAPRRAVGAAGRDADVVKDSGRPRDAGAEQGQGMRGRLVRRPLRGRGGSVTPCEQRPACRTERA